MPHNQSRAERSKSSQYRKTGPSGSSNQQRQFSGPMQSFGPQGGLQTINSGSDRWQRGTGFQKGLMPSPQTPVSMMHKAEKKYEVGRVTDDEEAKLRQLKAILNKLTPQNFEKLLQQVKQANIDNVITLSGVVEHIFDTVLMGPIFCEMYANFCLHLAADLPELIVDNMKITFKRLLLNKCQEEFERGEREEEEANKAEEEGEVKQTAEEREEKRLQVRRRMLGNIRLIGELYKKRMLIETIMRHCINKLLGQYQNPNEENIEALCILMSTIGEMIDRPKTKKLMDAYFNIMSLLSHNMKLSSRVRFMLKDTIDLRKNKWQERKKVEGPKKIEEVHRDAAQERQAQARRLARVPSMGSGQREDIMPRCVSNSFADPPIYDESHAQERNTTYGNREVRSTDRNFNGSRLNSPLDRAVPSTSMHNVSSEKVWPEEHLRDKSVAAIKEFYRVSRSEMKTMLDVRYPSTPKCLCNFKGSIRVVESTKPSKGKLYYCCSFQRCGFFSWCYPSTWTDKPNSSLYGDMEEPEESEDETSSMNSRIEARGITTKKDNLILGISKNPLEAWICCAILFVIVLVLMLKN